MNKQFDTLCEAYRLLNWEEKANSLQTIRSNYEENLYFVAFIGQFSAGKSCLINNLLEKNVLPSGVHETTPLLTYIRYSSSEYALLHFTDGTVWKLSLSEVRTITQKSQDWEPEKLGYLEIFVCADILRSGLILLDTPGINTLIHHHEHLLARTLDLASHVIYVVGHAPQRTDIDAIRMMAEYGMELACVRTHFDEINPNEESFEQTIQHDIELMSSCSIVAEKCFHISNAPESQWHKNIENIRDLLAQDGAHTTDALKDAVSKRLQQLRKECLDALVEKQVILQEIKAGNWEACSRKLEEYSSQINHFDQTIEQHRRQLKKDLHSAQSDILGRVRLDTDSALEKAIITVAGSSVASSAQMTTLMESQTQHILSSMLNSINHALAQYLCSMHSVIAKEQLPLDWSAVPEISSFNELRTSQNAEHKRLISRLEYLRSHRSELESQLQSMAEDPSYLKFQEELFTLEQELQEYSQSYNSIPTYKPQMVLVESGKMQPSQIAKTVGSLADWALMLIPGTAVTGVIKTAAESSKTVSKIAKVIGKSEKIMKAIENADKFKDVFFAINNMSKTYATKARKEKAQQFIADTADGAGRMLEAYQEAKKTLPATFLDYLTVEHWAEQIGKKFDSPPNLTIDREYEQQYQQTKAAIESEILDRQRRSYDVKCKQQLFLNEQERIAAEHRATIIDETAVSVALERKKAEISAAAQKKALQNWRQRCSEWYRSQLSPRIESILQQQMDDFASRLQQHFDDITAPLHDQLTTSKIMYEQLLRDRDSTPEELQQISALIVQLRDLSA